MWWHHNSLKSPANQMHGIGFLSNHRLERNLKGEPMLARVLYICYFGSVEVWLIDRCRVLDTHIRSCRFWSVVLWKKQLVDFGFISEYDEVFEGLI